MGNASARKNIREQIRIAADQQRSGGNVGEKAQKNISKQLLRLRQDNDQLAALDIREVVILERYEVDIARYRSLTIGEPPLPADGDPDASEPDSGNPNSDDQSSDNNTQSPIRDS